MFSNFLKKSIAVALFSSVSVSAYSATILVGTGYGEFGAAYANAQAGDTLLLQAGGNYTISSIHSAPGAAIPALVMDKSITISNASRTNRAMLGFRLFIPSEPLEDLQLTFQGVDMSSGGLESYANSSFLGNPNYPGDGELTLTFIDSKIVDFSTPFSPEADNLIVIGGEYAQRYSYGSSTTLKCGKLCYVAGITVPKNNLNLDGNGTKYVVGNYFPSSNSSDSRIKVYGSQGNGPAYIWGNRFDLVLTPTSSINSNGNTVVYAANANADVANNIFSFTHEATSDALAIYTQPIRAFEGANNLFRFRNNTISFSAEGLKANEMRLVKMTSGSMVGNIISGFDFDPFFSNPAVREDYNLCPSSAEDGVCGNSAIYANADFADVVSFHLNPTSPAVNKGDPSLSQSDLDGTRNDMGAYGGSLSIEQFSAQLAVEFSGPYIYPMFHGNSSVEEGTVAVQVITAARLPD